MAILARIRTYVPEVGGNREKPSEEQFIAHIKPVSVFQKQVQLRKYFGMSSEELLKNMMEEKNSNEVLRILKENVVKLENLWLAGDDGSRVLASIEDCWNMGEFELCMELFNNLLGSSQLKREEEKNSESPSGTSVIPNIH